jgi:hypothetical protein
VGGFINSQRRVLRKESRKHTSYSKRSETYTDSDFERIFFHCFLDSLLDSLLDCFLDCLLVPSSYSFILAISLLPSSTYPLLIYSHLSSKMELSSRKASEVDRLSPSPSSAAGQNSSSLAMKVTKKTALIGGTAFTTFATVLIVCLVVLVFSESVSNVDAATYTTPLTLHVLDTSTGIPASGVYVELERNTSTGWVFVGSTTTGSDGRGSTTILPETAEVGFILLFYVLSNVYAADN